MNPKNESFRWKMYKARGICPGAGAAVSASKEQRMVNLHAQRRNSRWGEMLKRRNIAEGTMSPIYSPCISNKKGVDNKQMLTRTKERMELLKWQQEKKKRLEKQKATAKPIFKLYHVSEPATYDLDKVYKQIKGQPIAASSKNNQESYRLVSSATYKFKPPANIKPVALADKQKPLGSKAKSHTNGTRKQKCSSTQQSRSKTNFVTRTNSRVNNQEPQPSMPGLPGAVLKVRTIKNSIKSSSETSYSPASPAICKSKNDRSIRRHSTRHQVMGEDTSSAEASDKEKEPSLSTKMANPEITANGATKLSDSERAFAPSNKDVPSNVVYVSPFLTMSRGKDNAQEEYHRRSAPGDTSSAEASDKEKEPSLSTKTANPEITANGATKSSDSERALAPSNKDVPSNVVYVSPFLTMSRGKDNAQEEYHRRSAPGGLGNEEKQSPYTKHDESKSTSPKAAATYFYKLLMDQIVRLQSLCKKWKEEHNFQEEVCDMIYVAIGQTDLLFQKKLKQIKGLIQCCESEDSERQVTCLDLHGFWATMMITVIFTLVLGLWISLFE